jgi:hypothetical protein
MSLPKLVPSETNYLILVHAIYNFGLNSTHTCKDNKIFCVRNIRVRTSH